MAPEHRARAILAGLDGVRSARGSVYAFTRICTPAPSWAARSRELGRQEHHRTASAGAGRLRAYDSRLQEGVGGTGVVGVLAEGDWPTVLPRADRDAPQVRQATGLPCADAVRDRDASGRLVSVAYACGHGLRLTWLLGAARPVAGAREKSQGTALTVLPSAEEAPRRCGAVAQDVPVDYSPRCTPVVQPMHALRTGRAADSGLRRAGPGGDRADPAGEAGPGAPRGR
ncbi:hypothetical protein [Streptomyces sp. NPDC046985]|uniref:hypothetical protein n=1 Tax=Streptomyces sp. NPDC046985 TaxID=3155377 RepID=UPI00340C77DC